MQTRNGKRSAAALGLLGLLAGGLAAQQVRPEQVLGRDDLEFAGALQRVGYTDLYRTILDLVEDAGKVSGPEAEYERIMIRLRDARSEQDTSKRKDQLAQILKAMEAFIAANQALREATDMRNELPVVYQTLAETFSADIETHKDDLKKVGELRGEGLEIFKKATEVLTARTESLEDEKDSNEENKLQHMIASYSLARIIYFHSLIYAPDSIEKKKLLDQALERFQSFDLDYGDMLMNVEGKVYQALILRDQGNAEEAMTFLDDAIKVREDVGKEGKYWKMDPAVADYVSVATRQKVLLLTQLKQYDKAVEAGKDFLETTQDALITVAQGKAVLYAIAEAQANFDEKAARETANRLSEADPAGYWGTQAKRLIGRMFVEGPRDPADPGLTPEKLVEIAETLALSDEAQRAIPICMSAIARCKGTDKEAAIGTDAYIIIGAVYAKREWLHEAAAAFDAAWTTYPSADKAPDALWRALDCYLRLGGEEKLPFYKKRMDERRTVLAQRYPTHPRAGDAQLIEAKQSEFAKEYEKAADLYLKIQPQANSANLVYYEARFRAANCQFQHARQLFQRGKGEDGKRFAAMAEKGYRDLRRDLDEATKKTLDTTIQGRYQTVAFHALVSLSALLLQPETGRPDEVLKLLDTIDPKVAAEPDKITQIWDYRIRALQALGRTDDAVNLLEAYVSRGGDEIAIANGAGLLAGALDKRAGELAGKPQTAGQAKDLWRKAARYYMLHLRPQLTGKLPLRSADGRSIGNRLYVIALLINDVPKEVASFVDWRGGAVKDTAIWDQAGQVYEAVVAALPSIEATIALGNVHGFLGQWKDAALVYARLFTDEPVIDQASGRINRETLVSKPLLLQGYLEWGVCEHKLGVANSAGPQNDNTRRAIEILTRIGSDTDRDTKVWWQSRYHLIRALIDFGDFEKAKIAMRNLERTSNNFDGGKYGLAKEFEALKAELK
jgi:hypothetical protein